MALSKFLSGTHASILTTKKVLSGAKEINVTPWVYSQGAWSLDPAASTGIPLESIVADSLAITQDDPETSNIECETSDSPIKSVTKQGAWNITMTCADIQEKIVTQLLGYQAITSTGGTPSGTDPADYLLAPSAKGDLYVAIEIVFDTDSLVCPRVNLNAKIDASNLKSETVKCTISGVLEEYEIPSGTSTPSGKKGPFFINQKQAS